MGACGDELVLCCISFMFGEFYAVFFTCMPKKNLYSKSPPIISPSLRKPGTRVCRVIYIPRSPRPIFAKVAIFPVTCAKSMASFSNVTALIGNFANRFVAISVGFGIGGLVIYKNAADLLPNLVCKPIVGLKKEDEYVEVPERCKTQFNEVLKMFGYNNTDRISFFINQGVHPISAGFPSLPGGAVVSLPKWYIFENYEDVEKCGITFQGRDIKWDSELGIMIKECLLPNDDMIAFCIAHELAKMQRLDYRAINSFLAPTWLYMTFRIAYATPRILKLRAVLDVLLKLVLCRISYLCYKFLNGKLYHDVVYGADQMAAKFEPRMLQGGIDAFSKKLELNQIRRRLLGKQGKSYFTQEGNDIESYLYPLLTDRLERLKALNTGITLTWIFTKGRFTR